MVSAPRVSWLRRSAPVCRKCGGEIESQHLGVCGISEGWGQPNSLIVNGDCDRVMRVWDIKRGCCIYGLHGHTLTIRCSKMLQNRPVAASGSWNSTLRERDL
ncbi:hypothetical protein IW262DRAFT_1031738 [Armillaria fumosa]|nr:hypothetical protein IW262DRAFT_1031738 [Armillaria fumosa]